MQIFTRQDYQYKANLHKCMYGTACTEKAVNQATKIIWFKNKKLLEADLLTTMQVMFVRKKI